MPSPKTKLLLVDDDDDLRESFSMILSELGFKVQAAEDGFSALDAIRREMPDIIVSDLNMPGMSGFELLSVVRRRFPRVQVIAMSGALPGDGLELGVAADVFYAKGSNLTALFGSLKDMADPEGPRPPAPPAGSPPSGSVTTTTNPSANSTSSSPARSACAPSPEQLVRSPA